MSRATILDLPPEEENVDPIEENEVEEIQQEASAEVEQPPEPETTLPEKYQGKSLEEVVQMHQEGSMVR